MNQDQTIIFNLSFLAKEASETIAINYKKESISYSDLWAKISEISFKLNKVSNRVVLVDFKNPITQIIYSLAVIEAGGDILVVENKSLIGSDLGLDKLSNENVFLLTDNVELKFLEKERFITKLDIGMSQKSKSDIYNKGGIILASKKEAYHLNLEVIKNHVLEVNEAFKFKEEENVFAYKEDINTDVLELILPVFSSKTTLNIIDKTIQEFSINTITGTLKLSKKRLQQELINSIPNQYKFSRILLSSDSRITNAVVFQVQKKFNIKEIVATYQLESIKLSVIQSIITDNINNNIISIAYTKPFGKCNVQILDNKKRVTAINVPGILWFESKCISKPIGANKIVQVFKSGNVDRILRPLNYKSSFNSSKQIHLLNNINREIHLKNRSLTPDITEEYLKHNHQVIEAALTYRVDKNRLIAFVTFNDKEGTTPLIIKKWLKGYVASKNLPSHIEVLKELPKNTFGEINYEVLNAVEITFLENKNLTSNQKKLIEIWETLLEIEGVELEDNFFELGGHSLLATRLVSMIRKEMDIEIPITTVFLYPTVELLSQELVLESNKIVLPLITSQERNSSFIPLSFSQQRLWFLDQFQGSKDYHISGGLKLKGKIDVAIIEATLKIIIDRHEPLRTVIKEKEGVGYQEILETEKWNLFKNNVKEETREEDLISDFSEKAFDLTKDYMFRACLNDLGKETYLLVCIFHHIASDGWSIQVFIEEFISVYKDLEAKKEVSLKELSVQYTDYAVWQKKNVTKDLLEDQLNYWKEKLVNVTPLSLGVDSERSKIKGTKGASLEVFINPELVDRLREFSTTRNCSVFMTLLAGFKVLLYNYSRQEDICIGTPISGRTQQSLEGLIGFFVNTLAMRSLVNSEMKFEDLLEQVKSTALEAYKRQETPFEKVIEITNSDRDLHKNPLLQVMFSLENTNQLQELITEEFLIELVKPTKIHMQSDLHFLLEEDVKRGIALEIQYKEALFDTTTIKRLANHYEYLLVSILENSSQKIGSLKMIGKEEEEFLNVINNTDLLYDKNESIISLFEEKVNKTPKEVALVFGNQTMSYNELDEKSNRVASFLQNKETKEGSHIGILFTRGFNMIVSMLGVLKAGCAYVPLDPSLPASRLSFITEDARVEKIIYEEEKLKDFLLVVAEQKFIKINEILSIEVSNSTIKRNLDSTAYIMYTSGTTGTPKGISITDENILTLINDNGVIKVKSEDRVLQWSNYAFDGSTYEIFGGLLKGASLYLIPNSVASNVEELSKVIVKEQITVTFLTVALFNSFVDYDVTALKSFRVLLFGGDKASFNHVKKAFDYLGPGVLVNGYGPTETTTFAVCHSVDTISEATYSIPIGKPLSNTKVYILNTNQNLVPIGVVGELYIGGTGLSKGYLNKEKLTAEKFISSPFEKGERLYKTGDLVSCQKDGTITFVGRVDSQIKIRGYRIELAEIENVLFNYKQISSSCVIAKEDALGNKRLVGYVVIKETFKKENIEGFLKEKLPDYMVPRVWVTLESIPLTSNGKVNKKALPEPDFKNVSNSEYVAPRNEEEVKLVSIWEKLLNITKIGVNDNFFELGGHSLLATQVVSMIREEMGTEVSVRMIFMHPVLHQLSKEIKLLSTKTSLPKIFPQEKPKLIPLSYGQQGMWFLDKLHGTREYHISGGLQLKGNVDVEILETSLKEIINRHEVLRTVIKEQDGSGYQEVLSVNKWKLFKKELNNEINVDNEIAKFLNIPFNLSNDYMFRACLYSVEKEEYILACVFHHIASDGWSLPIFINEFEYIYKTLKSNKKLVLPELPIQYSDFAIWQRNNIKGEFLENQLSYWQDKLDGIAPLSLPVDFVRPSIQSNKGAHVYFELNGSLKEGLYKVCKEEEVTLFMLLLASFKVLLHKYSGQNDICIGTPIANRDRLEIENIIGYFVNTLALRSEVNQDLSFQNFLKQVKETTLESYEYQHAPFDKVVESIVEDRDTSITQIFQVMFDLRNISKSQTIKIDDLELKLHEFEEETSQFDLNFSAEEHEKGISFDMEYCTDLFERATIERMLLHYQQLLENVVNNYKKPIAALSIITAKEEKQLLYDFNATEVNYPLDLTVIDLFKEQVNETPDNIALSFRGEKMTYTELDEKSNQIANYLIKEGIKKDDLVGICLERSFEMVIGILGILKSGGAYVPIKPDYPISRIYHILEDIRCRILLTDRVSENVLELTNFRDTQIIVLDSNSESFNECTKILKENKYNSTALSYVIYTSGSTGKPKGALIEHKGLLNHLLLMIDELQLNEKSALAFTAPFTFDISVWQILSALLVGGTTVIYKEQDLLETNSFVNSLFEEEVTILQLVPSYTSSLLETTSSRKLEKLNYFLVTGEAVTKDVLDRWFKVYPKVPVVNAYGPAEASDDVSLHIMKESPKLGLVPIGKPVANTQIYVADLYGNLCPIGVIGELWIGGVGVGRGYLNLEKLTEEKFVTNPFTNQGRIYKTGDLGRWLSDGTIEFIGRADDQVKVRGHRIELGEIENILSTINGIISCCVLVQEDESGNNNLAGYLFSDKKLENEKIQEELKSKLPEYMVPKLWVHLDEMPLTPNGKIDKKTLLNIKPNNELSKDYVAATTPTEVQLTNIWKTLLGIKKVGIHDNFFELGGHSLLATRLVSMIRKDMNIEIPIQLAFTHPTIAMLSKELPKHTEDINLPPIVIQEKENRIPLSFSQERLWFLDQFQGSLGYHMSGRIEIEGQLSIPVLESAFKKLIERHQTLRTIILKSEEGVGYQKIISADQWRLNIIKKLDIEEVEKDIVTFSSEPFDLSKDYMLRARVYVTSTNKYTLTILIHHIASDGWSEGILINELAIIYNALYKGEIVQLPKISLQYSDYATWQRKSLDDVVLDKQLSYWKKSLDGIVPLSLKTDYPRPAVQGISGSFIRFELNKNLKNDLLSICKNEEVTLFMLLLSTFKVLLSKYSGQDDICVGTPIANRTQSDIESIVGFFVNTVALRTNLKGNPRFKDLLTRVKEVTLNSQDNQLTPFEKVVDKVVTTRDLSITPLFQVLFVLDNTPRNSEFVLENLDVSILDNDNPNSKFDITLRVEEVDDTISFDFEYSTDLFKESTIRQMVNNYQQLLETVVKDVYQPIKSLQMLTSEEFVAITEKINDTTIVFEKANKTIDQLFSEKAKLYPNKIGLVDSNQKLSLQEIDELSTILASHILDKGGVNSLIAIYMEPSVELMIAILAIFKAGCAYVPIDIELPQERIQHIIEDSDVGFMIATNKYIKSIDFKGITISIEDNDSWTYKKLITETLNSSDKLAYVIYTSGSTGKPKGVRIAQNQLVNYVNWFTNKLEYTHEDNSILLSSFAFDLGHSAVFPTISNGGTLHLLKKEEYLNINNLHSYLDKENITFIKVTPTLFSLIINDSNFTPNSLANLNHLMLGGESIIYNDLTTFFNHYPKKKVINHYGPTEATIGCVVKSLSKENYHEIKEASVIGRPISNMKAYILDSYLQPVVPGVIGQLYLSGVGISEGYHNHSELNKDKFIANPFVKDEIMYNTGDLACWSTNHEVIFKGREDDQLKIRGYRVELAEIETILLDYVDVLKSCVLAKEDKEGANVLVGYIVTKDEFDKEQLEQFLSNRLPDYMIPKVWVELSEIPFTDNGKVDKKKLPDPEIGVSSVEYVAPRNELDSLLVDIWQKLLGVEKIGICDNFFELGGDSITAIQVSSYLYKKEYKIEIRDIMRYPTIKGMVGFVKPLKRIAKQGITSGNVALTPIQKAFFTLKKEEEHYYNQSVILSAQKRVDIEVLQKTLAIIQYRHDVLRSTYKEDSDIIIQTIQEDILPVILKVYDLPRATTLEDVKEEAKETQSSISLINGPLMHTAVFKTDKVDYILIAVHHLVIDGVSWRILLEDFNTVYSQISLNKPVESSVKTDSFKVWSQELESFVKSFQFNEEKEFWNNRITEIKPTKIPYDLNKEDKGLVSNRLKKTIQLEKEYVQLLETKVHTAFNTEVNDILLTALSQSIYKLFGILQSSIMLESHGRAELNEVLNFSRTIGWFTSVYPVYLPTKPKESFSDLIKDIKEYLHKIPNNGIGFGLLKYVDDSDIAKKIKKVVLPQIVFNYLGNIDSVAQNNDFELQENHLDIDESIKNESNYPIEFLGHIKDGILEFSLYFHSNHFKEETIKKWLAVYKETLIEIIDFCANKEHTETTPSDYDYSDLSLDDLVELNDLF